VSSRPDFVADLRSERLQLKFGRPLELYTDKASHGICSGVWNNQFATEWLTFGAS